MEAECKACGAKVPASPRLPSVRDPQSDERFAIVRCPACGAGRTSPAPADLAPYYGPAYYGGRHSFTASYCAARRVRVLRRAVPRGKVLDIGCGDGTFLLAAKDAGWSTFGTEIGGGKEIADRTGLDVRGSLEEVASAAPFDAITMWHTLEHFRDPLETVERARALLAPGGAFVVAVPDAAGLQATLFKSKWFHLDVPRHLYHFDRRSLEHLLEAARLRVERLYHLEIELDLFGWLQSALNAVMPHPNVLFQSLTGKPRAPGATTTELAASYALGTVLGPAALAATAVGSLSGRGATLVAIARGV